MPVHTYKIIMRKKEPKGTLEMFEDTCQATTVKEADDIFAERHGRGFVVSGPYKIDPVTNKLLNKLSPL